MSDEASHGYSRVPTARTARLAALGALMVVTALVAALLLRGSGDYRVHALFASAGGVVVGGDVRVGGRKVGEIDAIALTDDNQADITLRIDSDEAGPLSHLTRASIRAVGQAGVANRYVDLDPGPARGAPLRDGDVLPATQTSGYVNLDAVLSSLDPPSRRAIQALVRRSADVYAGSGAEDFNRMLGKLSPGLRALAGFSGDLGRDEAQLERLIAQSARAAAAISERRTDLAGAVEGAAGTFRALAAEREALVDSFGRAPVVLRQGQGTLARASIALHALRPVLRDVPAAAQPLAADLRDLPPSLRRVTPSLDDVASQLPDVAQILRRFTRLRGSANRALRSTATALTDVTPILRGLRYYGSDLILGIFNGLVGISTAPYDASGHYVHLEFTQSPQQLFGGAAAGLVSGEPLVPGLLDLKFKRDARCPGGAAPPARDGSSPWIPDPSICNPDHDLPASVNRP